MNLDKNVRKRTVGDSISSTLKHSVHTAKINREMGYNIFLLLAPRLACSRDGLMSVLENMVIQLQ